MFSGIFGYALVVTRTRPGSKLDECAPPTNQAFSARPYMRYIRCSAAWGFLYEDLPGLHVPYSVLGHYLLRDWGPATGAGHRCASGDVTIAYNKTADMSCMLAELV